MKDILTLNREEILALKPEEVNRLFSAEEVLHIAKTLNAFWTYNYKVMREKPGLHALLKSERHSDGFFVSRILLDPENIRKIFAQQMIMRLREVIRADLSELIVIGIPDGASALGKEVAELLGARNGLMEKVDGKLHLVSSIAPGEPILLVEDFCTRGTGFLEAVGEIRKNQPRSIIIPFDLVILNRGGLKTIGGRPLGVFQVLPVVERQIEDWNPNDGCPLCSIGSKPIKPKATDENWRLLNSSQL